MLARLYKYLQAMYLQNATYSEMKQMFLKKVDHIIFAEHKIRSLQ